MSTIKGIFEPFYEYVQDQLETRKKIIGSAKRDSKFFKVYTERQCVIRMASGVNIRNQIIFYKIMVLKIMKQI